MTLLKDSTYTLSDIEPPEQITDHQLRFLPPPAWTPIRDPDSRLGPYGDDNSGIRGRCKSPHPARQRIYVNIVPL